MSDDANETLDARMERLRRRAETFRDLLDDGDVITVAKDEGEIHVGEIVQSRLERQHPKLYGRLLAIEAQLTPGMAPVVATAAFFGAFVLGLQTGWWEPIFGQTACDALNQWWFWAIELLIVWYVIRSISRLYRKKIYNDNRNELAACITAEGLDRDILLVILLDHDDLAIVTHALKLDSGPHSA